MDSVALFKALGDSSRLAMLKALIDGPMSAEELCESLNLVPSTISHHASKLVAVNLVRSEKEKKIVSYYLHKTPLNSSLLSLIQSSEEEAKDGRSQRWEKQVLKTFIQCGQLLSIPKQRKKRRVILVHIVNEFDEDKVYTEKEFSAILKHWHEDHCFLRREMIAEGLVKREHGQYWKLPAA